VAITTMKCGPHERFIEKLLRPRFEINPLMQHHGFCGKLFLPEGLQ
jgi:hypothetical protein